MDEGLVRNEGYKAGYWRNPTSIRNSANDPILPGRGTHYWEVAWKIKLKPGCLWQSLEYTCYRTRWVNGMGWRLLPVLEGCRTWLRRLADQICRNRRRWCLSLINWQRCNFSSGHLTRISFDSGKFKPTSGKKNDLSTSLPAEPSVKFWSLAVIGLILLYLGRKAHWAL